MSILNSTPQWTNGDLRRLGDALAAGGTTTEVHDRYNAVMLWHNDLAAEVATTLYITNWQACPPDRFDITARPKTVDTLVQKLQREPRLTLDQVQVLAGVRIDADITLDVQTALAEESPHTSANAPGCGIYATIPTAATAPSTSGCDCQAAA